jgi:ParB family chromosome partitioning protein
MELREIPISHIFLRKDARKIDDATVSALVGSIREVGLLNPIRVRPKRLHVEGIETDAYEVTAGGHRFKAVTRVGFTEVSCIVVTEDDLHAELSKLDENLCRSDLTHAERAKQTARRKAIYLELHPETASGASQAGGMNESLGRGRKVCVDVATFAEETSARTGKSKRAVELDAERGEKIAEEVLDKVRGTHLDKGRYLDRLKSLPPSSQAAKVEKDLLKEPAGRKVPQKNSDANRLRSAWNNSAMGVKVAFIKEFAEEIAQLMARDFGK